MYSCSYIGHGVCPLVDVVNRTQLTENGKESSSRISTSERLNNSVNDSPPIPNVNAKHEQIDTT
jgi:hypothetical protein